jgi:hypothetical protein
VLLSRLTAFRLTQQSPRTLVFPSHYIVLKSLGYSSLLFFTQTPAFRITDHHLASKIRWSLGTIILHNASLVRLLSGTIYKFSRHHRASLLLRLKKTAKEKAVLATFTASRANLVSIPYILEARKLFQQHHVLYNNPLFETSHVHSSARSTTIVPEYSRTIKIPP